jgi:transposase
MMSTTVKNPEITPIPVQLSETEFTAFIFPHLSMPKRGPKCKLGYHRLFNLILWVLYTGMQWKCLPIPTGPTGKPAIHYTNVAGSKNLNALFPKRLQAFHYPLLALHSTLP